MLRPCEVYIFCFFECLVSMVYLEAYSSITGCQWDI